LVAGDELVDGAAPGHLLQGFGQQGGLVLMRRLLRDEQMVVDLAEQDGRRIDLLLAAGFPQLV